MKKVFGIKVENWCGLFLRSQIILQKVKILNPNNPRKYKLSLRKQKFLKRVWKS